MIIKTKLQTNKKLFCINDYIAYSNFDFSANKREIKYNSEVILVTNCINLKNVLLFLFWHLYIIKFDHIVVFDNSDIGILEKYITLFDNKITYIKKPGVISQSDCYNAYLKISNAKWILPIDDDEFLYISDKYNNNINTYLTFITENYPAAKYSFNWRMYYSIKDVAPDADDFYISMFQDMFYCHNYMAISPQKLISCNHVKTIINTDYPHLYLNDNGGIKQYIELELKKRLPYNVITPMGSTHNPITKLNGMFYHAINTETYLENIDYYYDDSMHEIKNDVYLAHFHYKTINEYIKKCKNFKFTNISNTFKHECYTLDAYNRGINFIRKYLVYNDELFELLNKNKNEKFNLIFKNIC